MNIMRHHKYFLLETFTNSRYDCKMRLVSYEISGKSSGSLPLILKGYRLSGA